MKAVWITPSDLAAPPRRLSRSSREPRCTSAPAAASDLAAASERASPSTSCPAPISSRTIAEPMNPVAPVTKTRMMLLAFLLRPWKKTAQDERPDFLKGRVNIGIGPFHGVRRIVKSGRRAQHGSPGGGRVLTRQFTSRHPLLND